MTSGARFRALFKKCIGRQPYKQDKRSRQTAEQREARVKIVRWLDSDECYRAYGCTVALTSRQCHDLIGDAGGDRLSTESGITDRCSMTAGGIAEDAGHLDLAQRRRVAKV